MKKLYIPKLTPVIAENNTFDLGSVKVSFSGLFVRYTKIGGEPVPGVPKNLWESIDAAAHRRFVGENLEVISGVETLVQRKKRFRKEVQRRKEKIENEVQDLSLQIQNLSRQIKKLDKEIERHENGNY